MSFVTSLAQQLPATTQTGLPVGAMYPSSQMNSQTYLSRVPSLPENLYGTSHLYPPTSTGTRPDTSGYYPARNPTESLKAPSAVGQHYYVDHMMNPHPYSSLYPFDINAVRRKNATRETTGPLKAWLKQHRQNPYPTKGEKVMLAISTRMTLTQVSTWFANARRRMKKDKFDDEDEDKEELEDLDDDKKRMRSGSVSSRVSHSSSEGNTSKDLSDFSDAEEMNIKNRPTKKCVQRLFSPEMRHDHVIDQSSSPESLPERPQSIEQAFFEPALQAMSGGLKLKTVSETIPEPTTSNIASQKSKIWSISEIIGSATKTVECDFTSNYNSSISNFGTIPASYNAYTSEYYQIPATDYSYHDQLQVYPHQELSYGLPRTQVSPTERIQYL